MYSNSAAPQSGAQATVPCHEATPPSSLQNLPRAGEVPDSELGPLHPGQVTVQWTTSIPDIGILCIILC